MTLYSLSLVLVAANWLSGSVSGLMAASMAVLVALCLLSSRRTAAGVR